MSWSMLAVLASKVFALLSQVILGSLLIKADFAVYALAASIFTLVAPMTEQGVQRLLVVSGSLEETRRRIVIAAYGMASISVLALTIASYILYTSGRANEGWVLFAHIPLLWISVSVGLSRARLQRLFAFKELATATTSGALAKGIVTVCAAVLGAEFYSFVIGLVIGKAIELGAMLRGRAKHSNGATEPVPWTVDAALNERILLPAIWILFGALFTALANNADYLILGLFGLSDVLAAYYFGYQMVAAASTVLVASIATVFLPTFVSMSGRDKPKALLQAIETAVLVASPIFAVGALVAHDIFGLLWGEKWLDAAPVVICMFLALCSRIADPLVRAFMESNKNWGRQAGLLAVDAIGFATTAWLLCEFYGSGLTVAFFAMWVGVYRFGFGCVLIMYGVVICGKLPIRSLATLVYIYLLLAISIFGLLYAANALDISWVVSLAFVVLWGFVACSIPAFRSRYRLLFAAVHGKIVARKNAV